jgi:hypothetical protein
MDINRTSTRNTRRTAEMIFLAPNSILPFNIRFLKNGVLQDPTAQACQN